VQRFLGLVGLAAGPLQLEPRLEIYLLFNAVDDDFLIISAPQVLQLFNLIFCKFPVGSKLSSFPLLPCLGVQLFAMLMDLFEAHRCRKSCQFEASES
jgi:hypothetical protein